MLLCSVPPIATPSNLAALLVTTDIVCRQRDYDTEYILIFTSALNNIDKYKLKSQNSEREGKFHWTVLITWVEEVYRQHLTLYIISMSNDYSDLIRLPTIHPRLPTIHPRLPTIHPRLPTIHLRLPTIHPRYTHKY